LATPGAAFAYLDRAARKIDAACERADRALEKIQRDTFAPTAPTGVAGVVLHSEIRAALARMTHEARSSAINAAIQADDKDSMELVSAVLNGVPVLTGIGAAELEMRRDQWRRRRFPSEIARAERIRKSRDALSRGASLLMGFISDLAGDASSIEAAEASDTAAQAAIRAAQTAGV
jgi:hypothetical protein